MSKHAWVLDILGDALHHLEIQVGPEVRPCMSSSESELYAAVLLSLDLVWTRQLLIELGVFDGSTPSPVFIDNIGAETIMQDPGQHKKFRHIRRRWYYIRALCGDGTILPIHVSTEYQQADIMTKALTGEALHRHGHTVQNVPNDSISVITKLLKDECQEVTVSVSTDRDIDLSGTIQSDGTEGLESEMIWGSVPGSAVNLAREFTRFHATAGSLEEQVAGPVFMGLLEGIGMSDEYLKYAR